MAEEEEEAGGNGGVDGERGGDVAVAFASVCVCSSQLSGAVSILYGGKAANPGGGSKPGGGAMDCPYELYQSLYLLIYSAFKFQQLNLVPG
jgi:hypothetical protein